MSSDSPTYPLVKTFDASASDAEIAQLVHILMEAFADDTSYGLILLGGDLSLGPASFTAQLRAALIGGVVHGIFLGPGAGVDDVSQLVGVAMWYPPGKNMLTSAEERAASGWDAFAASLPASLQAWRKDYFGPTILKLAHESLGLAYITNSWFLALFAMLPAHQGKGYGRVLFEVAERQAKLTNSNLVVQTPTEANVKIYERLGFTVQGSTEVKSDFGNAQVYFLAKEDEGVKECVTME